MWLHHGSNDWGVPQIVFTVAERERIEGIAVELDATAADFFADARPHLSDEQWLVLMAYSRSCVERALEIGSMLHAIVDEAAAAIPYTGRGRSAFVKAALEGWRDCFSPVPEIWRLADVCQKVPRGERRVESDVAVLEVMAANRMFGNFDQEYETFFRPAH